MTARHAGPSRGRSPWRPLAASAVGAGVLLVGGHGVWATLNATASGAQAVGTGTLVLQSGSSSLPAAVSGIGPGDTVNRHLVLTETGSLAASGLSLGISASSVSSTLVTDTATTSGLRVTVNSCTVPWTASTGVCSGTSAVALSQRSISSLVGTSAALIVPAAALAPSGSAYLQISLYLPASTETSTNGVGPSTSIQSAATTLTYTFTATQRAATTTTS